MIGGYDLPWEVVRGIRFERGNPWVTLELEDDDVVAVMAVQAADKEHAVAGRPGPAGAARRRPTPRSPAISSLTRLNRAPIRDT